MSYNILKDKKIIFICPSFIGYNDAIKTEIENLGGHVLMFNDRPYNGLYDFFKKINLNFIKLYQYISWHLKLRKTDLSIYNTLFVIRGEHVPCFVLNKLKKSGLEMIMYQWDSVKNYNYLYQKDFFDRISTFDREDSRLYGFNYFPLFFRKEYGEIEQRKLEVNNALFVGTFQSKRYDSVLVLKQNLSKVGINTIIKIKIPFYYYLKLMIKGIKLEKKHLVFENISFAEILKLYSNSDIIIDIANENQTGLTMRTFEALGANKILLTNNLSILEESFYNSKNIKFFNHGFSKETFKDEIITNLVEEQRLDNWIIRLIM